MSKKPAINPPRLAKQSKDPSVLSRTRKTKKGQLISLLSKPSGVDVPSISKKLGWQTHSTRAALSGLRKNGYKIERTMPGNGRPSRYHIASAPTVKSV